MIHIQGICYGVKEENATALGCSYYNIEERIKMRGYHFAPFVNVDSAKLIAESYRAVAYNPDNYQKVFFGLTEEQFSQYFIKNKIVWAPDGDEAFDDGSYILQFDIGDKIRLIGFKSTSDFSCDSNTLSELWISADEYYSILQSWYYSFKKEWLEKIKTGDE